MEIINKMPNWLRYILAIPFGILCVFFIAIIINISNLWIASPDSLYVAVVNFIFRNGINVLVLFYGINLMLPKYKFQITLILAIIIGIFYSAIEGIAVIQNGIDFIYLIAFVELILALIVSCVYSFKNKFD